MEKHLSLFYQYEEDLSDTFEYYKCKYTLAGFPFLRPLEKYLLGHSLDGAKLKARFLKHQKFAIPRSLTSPKLAAPLLETNRFDAFKRKALDFFAKLCCLAGDNVFTDPEKFPAQIIATVRKEPFLADELFAQLVKQTTDNFSASRKVYWKLLYLFLVHLVPSPPMRNVLYSHTASEALPAGFAGFDRIEELAKNCFLLLQATESVFDPTTAQQKTDNVQLEKYWQLLAAEAPFDFAVRFADDTLAQVQVLPSLSVEYVIKAVTRKAGLSDYKNWYIGFRPKRSTDKQRAGNHFYSYTKIPILNFATFFWNEFGKENVRFYLFHNRSAEKATEVLSGATTNKFLARALYYQLLTEFSDADKYSFFRFDTAEVREIVAKALFVLSLGEPLGLAEVRAMALKLLPAYALERVGAREAEIAFSNSTQKALFRLLMRIVDNVAVLSYNENFFGDVMNKTLDSQEAFLLSIIALYNEFVQEFSFCNDKESKVDFVVAKYKESLALFLHNDYCGPAKIRCDSIVKTLAAELPVYKEAQLLCLNTHRLWFQTLRHKTIFNASVREVSTMENRGNSLLLGFGAIKTECTVNSRYSVAIRRMLENALK